LVLLCFLALLSFVGAQKPKLTRVKVEQLIQAHAPDELIARQIRPSKVGFPLGRKAVEVFSAKGAGPLIVEYRMEVIRGEGEVNVTLTHRHAGIHGFVHDAILSLNRDGLSFHTPVSVNGCKLPNTTQPYRSLSRLIFQRELYRELRLNNVTPDMALEFGFIQAKHFTIITSSIDYDSAGNLLEWYDIAAPGLKMGLHSYSPLQSPSNAGQLLAAITVLIGKVRG
jgi:hypothetical protein